MMTPNWVAQTDLEDLVALMDQEVLAGPEVLEVPMVLEVWAGPAKTLPMSKTSCGNS